MYSFGNIIKMSQTKLCVLVILQTREVATGGASCWKVFLKKVHTVLRKQMKTLGFHQKKCFHPYLDHDWFFFYVVRVMGPP